jgi:tetratricopeptide (TPR) repeat protein
MPLKRSILFLLVSLVIPFCGLAQTKSTFEFKTDSLKARLKEYEQNDSLKIKVLLDLAYWNNTFDIAQSLNYLAEAEKIARQINIPIFTARVYFTYGNSYLNRAEYRQALFHFLQALHIYEQIQKKDNIARCLYNIGVIYISLNKTNLAEKYFTQALDIKLKSGLLDEVGIAYAGVGYIAELNKDYPKALYYYNKTLTNGVENKNKHIIQIAYSDIGGVYLAQKNISKAKRYLSLSLKMSYEAKNIEQICINCISLGGAYLEENNLPKAEYYFKEALSYAQKSGLRNREKQAYQSLSEVYHKLKKDEKAYLYRLRYEALNDSALNQETYKQVNDLQASYEIEKRNAQINLLNKEKELAEANASKDELYRFILIIACILTLVFVFILWRNIRLKQRLNRTLINENSQLEAENITAKYEVLKSRVNPHFLFNSLNTLTSIIEFDKQKAIEFIEHFSELFRQILESGEISFITLNEEMKITQNYIYLQKVRFGSKVHFEFNLTNEQDYIVPSFAIQMMIENAIKHNIISSSKNLYITVTQHPDYLTIENNLQPRLHNVHSTNVGQQNIIGRYKHFSNAIPTFEQTETHYKVTIPLIHKSTKP